MKRLDGIYRKPTKAQVIAISIAKRVQDTERRARLKALKELRIELKPLVESGAEW